MRCNAEVRLNCGGGWATPSGMGLSIEDRFKQFLPGVLYYPHKIAKEMRRREPELAVLHQLVPAGCTAIDVGCNRGYYSYALAKLAARVEAFEPNPALAAFARRKLGAKVRVHQAAVANRAGRETFYIPRDPSGVDSHLVGNLGNLYPDRDNAVCTVDVVTLDGFAGLDNVGFIKIDVEGAELAVIEGARATIARWQPNLLVELLLPWHDSRAEVAQIAGLIGYDAAVLIGGTWHDADTALTEMREAVTSNNVLFRPKSP